MTIIPHNHTPLKKGHTSKVMTRSIVDETIGARTITMWEQFLPQNGFITGHTHDIEETLTFLSGSVTVTIGENEFEVAAPATVFIPPHTYHAVKNAAEEMVHLLAFFPTDNPTIEYPNGKPALVDWQ